MLYQRRRLSTNEDVGEPEPLPANLRGLPDDTLADLSASGYPDTGYFPVVEPPPPPEPIRWIHKAIYLRRFTSQERIPIFAARGDDPILNDLLYVLESADNIFLDDPDLGNGLLYLVSRGLLEPARVAEILA
jgi:hypothetical protein